MQEFRAYRFAFSFTPFPQRIFVSLNRRWHNNRKFVCSHVHTQPYINICHRWPRFCQTNDEITHGHHQHNFLFPNLCAYTQNWWISSMSGLGHKFISTDCYRIWSAVQGIYLIIAHARALPSAPSDSKIAWNVSHKWTLSSISLSSFLHSNGIYILHTFVTYVIVFVEFATNFNIFLFEITLSQIH